MSEVTTVTPFLELDGVAIGFGPEKTRTDILRDVNLEVGENEFVAIIGFSGSGKSTLVSLLAGLERPTEGEVRMEGVEVTRPGPRRGVMFQSYSLLPWLSVFGNIELAVKQVFPSSSSVEVRKHVDRYIEMVNLADARDKAPHELSGGMRQRVSLARTLAMQPDVLLLDEPLSALDALTRAVLQDEILQIWEKEKKTVVLITNDVDEAILLADRIIPLTMGPEATLADAFPVNLERPRDRRTLTDQPLYRRLKSEITSYLVGLNKEARKLRGKTLVAMPEVKPRDFKLPSMMPGQ
ncbi:MAG: nitrate ABC transporter ATP-binding protein [Verrucomicrobiaceae bacterium]|jgi:nitrate/nitrite transport system ATP-binding protein|nr:nitrate ABC transporter ATP-binding protein [Verrucomicrobiaceae bacterium]